MKTPHRLWYVWGSHLSYTNNRTNACNAEHTKCLNRGGIYAAISLLCPEWLKKRAALYYTRNNDDDYRSASSAVTQPQETLVKKLFLEPSITTPSYKKVSGSIAMKSESACSVGECSSTYGKDSRQLHRQPSLPSQQVAHNNVQPARSDTPGYLAWSPVTESQNSRTRPSPYAASVRSLDVVRVPLQQMNPTYLEVGNGRSI